MIFWHQVKSQMRPSDIRFLWNAQSDKGYVDKQIFLLEAVQTCVIAGWGMNSEIPKTNKGEVIKHLSQINWEASTWET